MFTASASTHEHTRTRARALTDTIKHARRPSPVGDSFHACGIPPGDHVSDLAPSVFADPVVPAGAVTLYRHLLNATVTVRRRADPVVTT